MRPTIWSWEAALTPFWGWWRHVPWAIALSAGFPVFVLMLAARTPDPTRQQIAMAYGIVGLAYVVLYGVIGHRLFAASRPAGSTAGRPTRSGLLRPVAALMIAGGNLMAVALAAGSPAYSRARVSYLKGQLRTLADAQERFFVDSQRYAGTLEVLQLAPGADDVITITSADASSWSAEISATGTQVRCRIRGGDGVSPSNREPVCEGP